MKVLVTGVGGQLGHDVMNELAKRGHEGTGTGLKAVYSGIPDGSEVTKMPYFSMDITDSTAVENVFSEIHPDVVVHCAAWTAVDSAEEDDNRDKAARINVDGTKNIVRACQKEGCRLLYLSTDYVFDGQGDAPWDPDCEAYAPLNVYGETKLKGEMVVAEQLSQYFILRIAWVFGVNGNNFVRTMLRLGRDHNQLSVVNDQIGTPTYTYDLARLVVDMIETEKYGYYHATNEGGYISWYDFTVEIFRQAAAMGHPEYLPHRLNVIPVTTQEYGESKAKRPFNSRLDKSKLAANGFEPLPDWQDALARYLGEIEF